MAECPSPELAGMIRAPLMSDLSQGTIFTCALAENYDAVPVHGLMITARCDTENEKVDILNYVPVVRVEDWVVLDGRLILAKRAIANANGSLRKALLDAGMASSIIDSIPSSDIIKELKRDGSKQGRSVADRFEKAANDLYFSTNASSLHLSTAESIQYVKNVSSKAKALIKELTGNQLSDFHFIDRCEPEEICHGYVALLREVRFIPARLGGAIAGGLDFATYKMLTRELPHASGKLRLEGDEDFSMPVGIVESPFIELMMQRLTLLFARIGVTDIKPDRLKSVQMVLDSLREELQ